MLLHVRCETLLGCVFTLTKGAVEEGRSQSDDPLLTIVHLDNTDHCWSSYGSSQPAHKAVSSMLAKTNSSVCETPPRELGRWCGECCVPYTAHDTDYQLSAYNNIIPDIQLIKLRMSRLLNWSKYHSVLWIPEVLAIRWEPGMADVHICYSKHACHSAKFRVDRGAFSLPPCL